MRRNVHFGFSLVEVVVALGIVTFCLLALIGLLPTGFLSARNAREEAAATVVLAQASEAIREASSSGANSYTALGSWSNLTWVLGGTATTEDYALTLGGVPTANDARLKVRVELQPPTDSHSGGRAMISVAWPGQAEWTGGHWEKSQGSVSTWLNFLPRP